MHLSRRRLLRGGVLLPRPLLPPAPGAATRAALAEPLPQADLTHLDGEGVVFAHTLDAHVRPANAKGLQRLGTRSYWEAPLDASALSGVHTLSITPRPTSAAGTWWAALLPPPSRPLGRRQASRSFMTASLPMAAACPAASGIHIPLAKCRAI